MTEANPNILVIGHADDPEFVATADVVHAAGRVRACGSVEHAQNWLYAANPPPEWIVIFQSRPGEFNRKMLDTLWQSAPLARIVRVLGAWCEGEVRTGQPWPGTARLYWHQAPTRLRAELSSFGNYNSAWHSSSTMTEEDRLLARRQPMSAEGRGLIGIYSRTLSGAESIADACSASGWPTVWLQPDRHIFARGLKACIFDASHSSDAEFHALAKITHQMPDVPTIALLSFPRLEDASAAMASGAKAVLSKPLLVEDLLNTLDAQSDKMPNLKNQAG